MRRDVKKELKQAVVERFAMGRGVTTLGLAKDMGYSETQASGKNGAYVRLQAWKESGLVTMQRASRGPGESPYIFNFTGRPVGSMTLADALRPFLNDEDLGWERPAVRSACRFLLDLPRKCAENRIIDAAETVPAEEIHSLPARAYEMTLQADGARNTAEARRTALRALLRHAATHDTIPLVFPHYRADDPWEVQAVRYFPLESQLQAGQMTHDLDPATRSTYRSAFRLYGSACQLAFGSDGVRYADPADLPTGKLKEVRAALVKSGRGHRWSDVGGMLNWIGKTHGVGPRVGKPVDRRYGDYLYPEKGRAVSRYDGFLAVFDHHGFPPEFREFFEVYRLMNTLPFDELELRSKDIPARRRARPLKDTTLMDHTRSIRHWLGIAVHRLNMNPKQMTLQSVFGDDFLTILQALKERWAEKAKDPNSRVSAAKTGGLHWVVVHAGLVAYALWRYRGLREGVQYRALVGKNTHTRLAAQSRQEEGEDMSDERRVFYNAYLESRRQADAITAARKAVGRTANVNTVKDLRQVFERTPPSYWSAILQSMIDQVDAWNREGRADDEFHEEVLATMLHGSFIAAGARGAELTHVRTDRHYPPRNWTERIIELWPHDRKNRGSHEMCLWENSPPRRIEEIYWKQTRPHFMAKSEAQHPFWLVDLDGRPWGCPEEDDHGGGRDGIAHKARVNAMRSFWSRRAAAAAVRAGLEIPHERYGFTLHAIRGVFGLLIFHTAGLEWAMNYTGDRSPDTITQYYTALRGWGIPPAERAVLDRLGAPPMLLAASTSAPDGGLKTSSSGQANLTAFREEYRQLQELADLDALTREELAVELEKLKARLGIGERGA